MQVREFQRHIAQLYLAKDQRRGPTGTMLWLVEETGELAEAVRRGEKQNAAEEMADMVAWVASLANLLDIDLETALAQKYPPTCKRCGAKPCACPEPTSAPL